MNATLTTYTDEQIGLIKRTICKGATDDELALFLHQCRRTGLDPFSRQIHAVKRWNSDQRRDVLTIQTGIDGYRLVADRTGLYAGNEEPVYGPAFEPEKGVVAPEWARVTVHKLIGGAPRAFSFRAYWREFAKHREDGAITKFWRTMPYLMLGKCAESGALRKAFPQELSGIWTLEELPEHDGADEDAFRHRIGQARTIEQLREVGQQLTQAAPSLTGGAVDELRKEYAARAKQLNEGPKRLPAQAPAPKPEGNGLAQALARIRSLASTLDLADEGLASLAGELGHDLACLSEAGAAGLLAELEQRATEVLDREER